MICIYCGGDTQVINSRLQKRPNQVWRRRKCVECAAIFSTHESVAYDAVWRVKKADGMLVPFVRNKLFISLYKSLAHRPSAIDDATALTDTIMGQLLKSSPNGLLLVASVRDTAHTVLERFDKAAAVSYQAFHP